LRPQAMQMMGGLQSACFWAPSAAALRVGAPRVKPVASRFHAKIAIGEPARVSDTVDDPPGRTLSGDAVAVRVTCADQPDARARKRMSRPHPGPRVRANKGPSTCRCVVPWLRVEAASDRLALVVNWWSESPESGTEQVVEAAFSRPSVR